MKMQYENEAKKMDKNLHQVKPINDLNEFMNNRNSVNLATSVVIPNHEQRRAEITEILSICLDPETAIAVVKAIEEMQKLYYPAYIK